MQIEKRRDDGALTVVLSGRLNTTTAPELEADLADLDGVRELVLDLAALEYISSAGLRTLLLLHRKMSAQGGMKLRHVAPGIMEVFKMTAFTKFLTIEE
ncbi:MAG: STAS domain-containing protein [Synergistaceae bacterium]|jgi:anti-sigma B factor antagonist|nr:STAS domain-containing protein [Synergistaceae bacterium]